MIAGMRERSLVNQEREREREREPRPWNKRWSDGKPIGAAADVDVERERERGDDDDDRVWLEAISTCCCLASWNSNSRWPLAPASPHYGRGVARAVLFWVYGSVIAFDCELYDVEARLGKGYSCWGGTMLERLIWNFKILEDARELWI